MLIQIALSLSILSIHSVRSELLCETSTIDSIAYANDQRMYFIASGGHYWWIKDSDFPPKDAQAQKLPEPFKTTTAAVYIDGKSGCQVETRSAIKGMRAKEKEVWIIELIDGKQKMMSFDTAYGRWGKVIDYDEDHCLAQAKIDFSQPIDAMFSRNLDIYLVQNKMYLMQDCKFICKDPVNEFGNSKDPQKTEDWGTKDPIHGMFVMTDKGGEKLLMFQKKLYFVMKLRDKGTGRVIATKDGKGKDIMTDFFRLKKGTKCTGPAPPPPQEGAPTNANPKEEVPPPEPPPAPENPKEGGQAGDDNTEAPQDSVDPTTKPDESSGSGLWIIIAIIVIVLIVVAIGLFLLFMMRKKTEDTEASKSSAVPKGGAKPGDKVDSKLGGKTDSKTGAKVSSKVDGSKAGSVSGSPAPGSKSAVPSKANTVESTRSGIAKPSTTKK